MKEILKQAKILNPQIKEIRVSNHKLITNKLHMILIKKQRLPKKSHIWVKKPYMKDRQMKEVENKE